MNDGIYHPQSPERMVAFQKGIQNLIAAVRAKDARLILLTPPPFDPVAVTTLPASAPDFSYKAPYEKYDDVLADYAAWEKTLAAADVQVIDLHTPINAYLAKQRATDPKFSFTKDGIHPDLAGHLLMARILLKDLGVKVPQIALNDEVAHVQGDPLYVIVKDHRQKRSQAWLDYIGYTREKTVKTARAVSVRGNDAPDSAAGRHHARRQITPPPPHRNLLYNSEVPSTPRLLLPILLALSSCAWADVTLPHILAEHMVIQRDQPVHIWGHAAPDEAVAVIFRGATQSTKADALGRFSVYLAPGDAGGPFDLTVKGNNTIAFKDILVGDVWIASGQSNMEFKLRQGDNAQVEIAAAKYPKIRRTLIDRKVSDYPVEDAPGQAWMDVNPENAANASAVAYFFARHIQEKEGGVPIGIIETFWGGTPVEAWMSLHAIGADPALMPIFSEWAKAEEAWPAVDAAYQKQLNDWKLASEAAKAGGAHRSCPARHAEHAAGWIVSSSGPLQRYDRALHAIPDQRGHLVSGRSQRQR